MVTKKYFCRKRDGEWIIIININADTDYEIEVDPENNFIEITINHKV